jgi:hypothetical protein
VIFGTWAGDTMAYFTGKYFGSTPMAPVLSPKKTWEGFAGGAISTVLLVVFIGLYTPLGAADSLVLGAVIAVAGPLGDLFESLIKRDVQIKDSGRGIPGHGGVLDRFDALIFASVASYFCSLVWLARPRSSPRPSAATGRGLARGVPAAVRLPSRLSDSVVAAHRGAASTTGRSPSSCPGGGRSATAVRTSRSLQSAGCRLSVRQGLRGPRRTSPASCLRPVLPVARRAARVLLAGAAPGARGRLVAVPRDHRAVRDPQLTANTRGSADPRAQPWAVTVLRSRVRFAAACLRSRLRHTHGALPAPFVDLLAFSSAAAVLMLAEGSFLPPDRKEPSGRAWRALSATWAARCGPADRRSGRAGGRPTSALLGLPIALAAVDQLGASLRSRSWGLRRLADQWYIVVAAVPAPRVPRRPGRRWLCCSRQAWLTATTSSLHAAGGDRYALAAPYLFCTSPPSAGGRRHPLPWAP